MLPKFPTNSPRTGGRGSRCRGLPPRLTAEVTILHSMLSRLRHFLPHDCRTTLRQKSNRGHSSLTLNQDNYTTPFRDQHGGPPSLERSQGTSLLPAPALRRIPLDKEGSTFRPQQCYSQVSQPSTPSPAHSPTALSPGLTLPSPSRCAICMTRRKKRVASGQL